MAEGFKDYYKAGEEVPPMPGAAMLDFVPGEKKEEEEKKVEAEPITPEGMLVEATKPEEVVATTSKTKKSKK